MSGYVRVHPTILSCAQHVAKWCTSVLSSFLSSGLPRKQITVQARNGVVHTLIEGFALYHDYVI